MNKRKKNLIEILKKNEKILREVNFAFSNLKII